MKRTIIATVMLLLTPGIAFAESWIMWEREYGNETALRKPSSIPAFDRWLKENGLDDYASDSTR